MQTNDYNQNVVDGAMESESSISLDRRRVQLEIPDVPFQVNEAIKDGVDVMGYQYWEPIDVVSAGTGEMRKRYGFVYVDRFNDGHGTLERVKKESYEWMKKVCESNGEYLEEEK